MLEALEKLAAKQEPKKVKGYVWWKNQGGAKPKDSPRGTGVRGSPSLRKKYYERSPTRKERSGLYLDRAHKRGFGGGGFSNRPDLHERVQSALELAMDGRKYPGSKGTSMSELLEAPRKSRSFKVPAHRKFFEKLQEGLASEGAKARELAPDITKSTAKPKFNKKTARLIAGRLVAGGGAAYIANRQFKREM